LPKILVIRLSSIGDIVLTSPVVRCLKQQLPGAEVHFAVKKAFLPVVEANPYIDKIHIFDHNIKDFLRELRKEKFDFIIDLHNNQRTLLIKTFLLFSSSPLLLFSIYSFPKLSLRKWLLVKFKWNLMPKIHIVDRYFKAVRKLGVKNDGKGLDYFIPTGETVDISHFAVAFRSGYVAFVIGAKHNTKALPEERIAELIRSSSKPVILLGGPEDTEKGERIASAVGNDRVFNACGKFSLNQSASLVQQAEKIITHDTGLMHIAAAFHKDIISIWGNTVPEFGMYPYLPKEEGKSTILEVKGLSCRPCSKLGYRECPKGHFRCMKEIRNFEF
jgi:ADP-heptose:LPS heptosyltransferase